MLLQAWDNFHLPDDNGLLHGVELRTPFLDIDVVRIGLSEPLNNKEILRRALRKVLPTALVDAPKSGFDTPFSYPAWIADQWPALRRAWLEGDTEELLSPAVRTRLRSPGVAREAPLLAWRAVALSSHLQIQRRPQILCQ